MKILVNELPNSSKECLFAEYISMTSKYKCMLQQGMYSRCNLDCGKECPYLETKYPLICADQKGKNNENC